MVAMFDPSETLSPCKILRGKALHDLDIDPPSLVLHRLVLCTVQVGRPLKDYTSDPDLLSGFRAALLGESLLVISLDRLRDYTSQRTVACVEKK